MKKLWILSLNDLRNIVRDKILLILFMVPMLNIACLYYLLPVVVEKFPVLGAYTSVVLAVFCSVTAVTPAYVISFIMLDEKDENLLTVMRVMPISPLYFIFYRMGFTVLFGFAGVLLTLLCFAGDHPVPVLLGLSLLFALMAPIATLGIVTFANNKVEGVTMLKGINFMMMLPLLAFFISSSWKFVLGIIPVYWTYLIFQSLNEPLHFATYFSIGLAMHTLLLAVLYRWFSRKVFSG